MDFSIGENSATPILLHKTYGLSTISLFRKLVFFIHVMSIWASILRLNHVFTLLDFPCFSSLFQTQILHGFCFDFLLYFTSILDAFWHHFSILFRSRNLIDFRMGFFEEFYQKLSQNGTEILPLTAFFHTKTFKNARAPMYRARSWTHFSPRTCQNVPGALQS